MLAGGCDQRGKTQQILVRRPAPKAAAKAPVVTPAAGVATTPSATTATAGVPKEVKDPRYKTFIRPLLTRLGCDSGSCHGSFKGGGLWFTTGSPEFVEDYLRVLERLDVDHPENSVLFRKCTGQVPHNGGKNLEPKSCDAQRLLAWIGDKPDPQCGAQALAANEAPRFGREVAPALATLGCAKAECHGGAGPGQRKLDLAGLDAGIGSSPQQVEAAFRSFSATRLNRMMAWMSPVLRAAWAEDGIHKTQVDLRSCAYRRLHGFIAQAPESTCDLQMRGGKGDSGPSFADFTRVVMPTLASRGCTDSGCHGSGRGDMALIDPAVDQHTVLHDYLMLTARVEDRHRPDDSMLLRTVRNIEPHGGGKRLGGRSDCVDRMVVSWLQGQRVAACPPLPPPSFERFATEVQPVLDKMTCTLRTCHGGGVPVFTLHERATAEKDLRENYQHVLAEIDTKFMPLSQVMLRMIDICAYGTVGAWIDGQQRPECTVHTPDPSAFPKVEKKIPKPSPI